MGTNGYWLYSRSYCEFNLGDAWVFWAMVLFCVKDSMMGVFAYIQRYPGIMTSSAVYVVIDAIGVYRWWIF